MEIGLAITLFWKVSQKSVGSYGGYSFRPIKTTSDYRGNCALTVSTTSWAPWCSLQDIRTLGHDYIAYYIALESLYLLRWQVAETWRSRRLRIQVRYRLLVTSYSLILLRKLNKEIGAESSHWVQTQRSACVSFAKRLVSQRVLCDLECDLQRQLETGI